MVQRLVVVLVVDLTPDLVPLLPGALPFAVLLAQAAQDHRHGHHRVAEELLDDIDAVLLAVNALDAANAQHCIDTTVSVSVRLWLWLRGSG